MFTCTCRHAFQLICVFNSVFASIILCVCLRLFILSHFFTIFFPQLQTESLGSGGFELGLVGETETLFFWPDWKQTTFLPKLI